MYVANRRAGRRGGSDTVNKEEALLDPCNWKCKCIKLLWSTAETIAQCRCSLLVPCPLWNISLDINCSIKTALEMCCWHGGVSSQWLGLGLLASESSLQLSYLCEGSLREMRLSVARAACNCGWVGLSVLLLGLGAVVWSHLLKILGLTGLISEYIY